MYDRESYIIIEIMLHLPRANIFPLAWKFQVDTALVFLICSPSALRRALECWWTLGRDFFHQSITPTIIYLENNVLVLVSLSTLAFSLSFPPSFFPTHNLPCTHHTTIRLICCYTSRVWWLRVPPTWSWRVTLFPRRPCIGHRWRISSSRSWPLWQYSCHQYNSFLLPMYTQTKNTPRAYMWV